MVSRQSPQALPMSWIQGVKAGRQWFWPEQLGNAYSDAEALGRWVYGEAQEIREGVRAGQHIQVSSVYRRLLGPCPWTRSLRERGWREESPGARQHLEARTSRGLYYRMVSRAVGTKYHTLPKSLYSLMVLEGMGLKSRVCRAELLTVGFEETPSLPLSASGGPDIPWLVATLLQSLLPSLHGSLFSLSVSSEDSCHYI